VGFQGVNLGEVAIQYVCLLFSLSVHEAAHAFMADRRGDPSARFLGRATLNPLAHIDPIGTVIMPLLMMVTGVPFLFGWAKPVPYNPRNLRNMRKDPALIALAGPAANFTMMIVFAVIMRVVVIGMDIPPTHEALQNPVFMLVFSMAMINMALMAFNLIPVPPLDGGGIIAPFLSANGQRILESIGPFGIIIAIIAANKILPGPMHAMSNAILWFAFWGQV